MSAGSPNSNFIELKVKPKLRKCSTYFKKLSVFPDTGANICLVGPDQLRHLGLKMSDLSSCNIQIAVAGGTHIQSTGKFAVDILLNDRSTEQVAYFSKKG